MSLLSFRKDSCLQLGEKGASKLQAAHKGVRTVGERKGERERERGKGQSEVWPSRELRHAEQRRVTQQQANSIVQAPTAFHAHMWLGSLAFFSWPQGYRNLVLQRVCRQGRGREGRATQASTR